jgi:hypothetical protein
VTRLVKKIFPFFLESGVTALCIRIKRIPGNLSFALSIIVAFDYSFLPSLKSYGEIENQRV